MSREAMEQAIEALEMAAAFREGGTKMARTAIAALRAALAERPAGYIDWQQRRGACFDILEEAILAYQSWFAEDDYHAVDALNKIMGRVMERYAAIKEQPAAKERDNYTGSHANFVKNMALPGVAEQPAAQSLGVADRKALDNALFKQPAALGTTHHQRVEPACPVCNRTPLFEFDRRVNEWAGRCKNCGVEGHVAATEDEARRLWIVWHHKRSDARNEEAEQPVPVMANGLTEAETNATASVAGLTPAAPVLTDAQIDAATCSERDALIDEIYEHGLNMEGILRRTTKFARAAIAAAIPPGCVVVPVEPTPEMKRAATLIAPTWDDHISAAKYRAMIAARPGGQG